jgi:hypothetical protein
MLRSILIVLLAGLALLWFCSPPAMATSEEFLTMRGLGDLQWVRNFYYARVLPFTPNYGATFSADSYGLSSVYKRGSGTFVPDPTGTPLILVNRLTGATVIGLMNATGGFTSGIHFSYTVGFSETVASWSEANGTAMVLATMTLSPSNRSCIHFPTYCNWSSAGLSFSGTAKSLSFSSDANGIGIFDITAGSTSTGIPEPSTFYMFGTGLIGISVAKVCRFRRIQKATRPTTSHVCP